MEDHQISCDLLEVSFAFKSQWLLVYSELSLQNEWEFSSVLWDPAFKKAHFKKIRH